MHDPTRYVPVNITDHRKHTLFPSQKIKDCIAEDGAHVYVELMGPNQGLHLLPLELFTVYPCKPFIVALTMHLDRPCEPI